MPGQAGQRGKLLALYRILWQETDENHPLTAGQLQTRLERYGIFAERKSLYDAIETLIEMGVEILHQHNRGYYLAERTFQLAELKLLVDAVQASKFITPSKSRALIAKLEGQASVHQAQALQRQVYVTGRAMGMNEAVLYAIDTIHAAITQNRQITFQYFDYNVAKEKVLRHGGKRYRVSPFLLLRSSDFYYLIAYEEENQSLRHYRVDKMLHLRQEMEPRLGEEDFRTFDVERYADTHFSMFSGQRRQVRLLCENWVSSIMIDRFGEEISMVPEDSDHFSLSVGVAVSPQFYGWVFGLGTGVVIAGPEEVRQGMRDYLEQQRAAYEE
jgi:predicted DNA-binding transcriptional regulator YafY